MKGTNVELSRQNKQLNSENHFLVQINEAFATENDELRGKLDRFLKIRLPKSIGQQSDTDRPSKRKATKSKGKKAVRCSDDELPSSEGSEPAEKKQKNEENEKGARVSIILASGSIILNYY